MYDDDASTAGDLPGRATGEAVTDERGRIAVRCACGKTLGVPKFLAGQTVGCPACRETVSVPAVSVPPELPPSLPDDRSREEVVADRVREQLRAVSGQEKSLGRNLGTLAITVILFISLGLFRSSISGVALLVGVIFLHECGHFIGMKLLKYKDIQMFFIPLFGAAVSGTEGDPSAGRRAVVSLLGPVPGIVIGIGTGVAYLVTRHPLLADATRTFLFLNTFNLLPFHPLDGGRLMDALLFSRHPKVEVAFKIITTLVLAWLAFTLKAVFLGFFAFTVLMTIRGTHISATIARKIRKEMAEDEECTSDEMPTHFLLKTLLLLKEKLPEQHRKPKVFASFVNEIWRRLRSRPCSVGGAIGLFLCYLFFVLLGAGSALMFEIAAVAAAEPQTELVTRTSPDGEVVRYQVATVSGHKISETQVNDEGVFDGTQTSWHIFSTVKSIEGQWREGECDGEWRFWDVRSNLTVIIEYDMGEPVRYRECIDGKMRDVPREEWINPMRPVRRIESYGARSDTLQGQSSTQ